MQQGFNQTVLLRRLFTSIGEKKATKTIQPGESFYTTSKTRWICYQHRLIREVALDQARI